MKSYTTIRTSMFIYFTSNFPKFLTQFVNKFIESGWSLLPMKPLHKKRRKHINSKHFSYDHTTGYVEIVFYTHILHFFGTSFNTFIADDCYKLFWLFSSVSSVGLWEKWLKMVFWNQMKLFYQQQNGRISRRIKIFLSREFGRCLHAGIFLHLFRTKTQFFANRWFFTECI